MSEEMFPTSGAVRPAAADEGRLVSPPRLLQRPALEPLCQSQGRNIDAPPSFMYRRLTRPSSPVSCSDERASSLAGFLMSEGSSAALMKAATHPSGSHASAAALTNSKPASSPPLNRLWRTLESSEMLGWSRWSTGRMERQTPSIRLHTKTGPFLY